MSKRFCLYRHFNAKGDLLYIGQSVRFFERLKEHLAWSWIQDSKKVELEFFPDKVTLDAAEIAAIKAEKPLHNIAYTPKMREKSTQRKPPKTYTTIGYTPKPLPPSPMTADTPEEFYRRLEVYKKMAREDLARHRPIEELSLS